jgi:hypothetical protein
MPPTEPDQQELHERRAYLRYPRRLETFWTYLGLGATDLAGGEVKDLSNTGVGLVLDQPFAPETALLLRLPTASQGWSSHLVRVKRCAEERPGRFHVGCAFIKPLSDAELQSLLGRRG